MHSPQPRTPVRLPSPQPLTRPLVLALRLIFGGACLAAAVLPVPAMAQVQNTAREFDIPAGPLAVTLNRIGEAAGLLLSFDPALVRSKAAPAIKGRLTAQQALEQALAGSGLAAAAEGASTVIRPAPPHPASRQSAREPVLPVVTVKANADIGEQHGRFSYRGQPAPVEPGVVKAATLQRYGADDLEDVFATQPEVTVGGGHAIAQKVYLRGIEDTLLNVTIDGTPQAGQTFHHTGRVQIEPELLKEVDVMAGTGDATAGPGALGGSLRFVTKDPLDMLRPGEQAGALVKATWFSNAEGFKAHSSVFARLGETWSGLASLTHQDQDNYKDGGGRTVTSTGTRQQLGFLKLVGHLDAGHSVRLSYDANRDEGERTQRPQWVASSFNRAYPLTSERTGWNLGYDYQPSGQELVDLKVSLYDSRLELEQNVIGRWGQFLGRVDSTGADLRNTSRLGMHRVTYGLDHRRDRISSGYGADPDQNRESGTVSGLYVQDSMTITPHLQLDFGARHDRYRLNDVNGATQTASGTSPNAGIRWSVLPDLALLAGHARALRGPKVRDAFKQEVIAVNAPDLKPERARTTDLGFEYTPGAWRLNAKAYRTTVRDAVADPIGRPTQFENVGTLESRGVLLHTAYTWQQVRMGVGYQHGTAKLNGKRLNGYDHNGLGTSQGNTVTASIDWRVSGQLEIGWIGRFVKGIGALETSAGTVRKPGYGVHDLQATWQPPSVKGLAVSLAVKNLFDKDYLDHGSNEDFQHIAGYTGIVGSREPGREVRLGLAMRF